MQFTITIDLYRDDTLIRRFDLPVDEKDNCKANSEALHAYQLLLAEARRLK